MNCPRCQTSGRPDARFCDQCGTPLQEVPKATSPVPPGVDPPRAVEWTRWVDPAEGAFAIELPRGWSARGGLRRDPSTGLPVAQLQVSADMPGVGYVYCPESHAFSEPGPTGMAGALFGMLTAMPTFGPQAPPLAFTDASHMAGSFFLAQWRRLWPDVSLLRAVADSREWQRVYTYQMEECAMRMLPVHIDGSSADVLIRYTSNGVPMLQGGHINCMRVRGNMGPAMPWTAEVGHAYFAPHDRFGLLEPVLRRMADSFQFGVAWRRNEAAMGNQRTAVVQQDIHRRQQQISRTLSETSDVVASTCWSSEQIRHQHQEGRNAQAQGSDWSHAWSNATLGWEDRTDDSGRRYSIEAGHERVWRDDAGNLHYGNQLTNPDPRWHELKKLP